MLFLHVIYYFPYNHIFFFLILIKKKRFIMDFFFLFNRFTSSNHKAMSLIWSLNEQSILIKESFCECMYVCVYATTGYLCRGLSRFFTKGLIFVKLLLFLWITLLFLWILLLILWISLVFLWIIFVLVQNLHEINFNYILD